MSSLLSSCTQEANLCLDAVLLASLGPPGVCEVAHKCLPHLAGSWSGFCFEACGSGPAEALQQHFQYELKNGVM